MDYDKYPYGYDAIDARHEENERALKESELDREHRAKQIRAFEKAAEAKKPKSDSRLDNPVVVEKTVYPNEKYEESMFVDPVDDIKDMNATDFIAKKEEDDMPNTEVSDERCKELRRKSIDKMKNGWGETDVMKKKKKKKTAEANKESDSVDVSGIAKVLSRGPGSAYEA